MQNIKIDIYISIILLGVLYECQTWSVSVEAEGVREGVLRSIFGPKADELTGDGWRHYMRSFIVCAHII